MMRGLASSLILFASVAFGAGVAQAADVVATYQFNHSLSADEAGAPALLALNGGSFVLDNTVLGQTRTVYQRFSASNASGSQSALRLDTAGLGLTSDSYAVELVFSFTDTLVPPGTQNYRRVVNGWDPGLLRDPGLYVGPSRQVNVFSGGPHAGGPSMSDGTYYDVVLSVSPGREDAYVNGQPAVQLGGATPDAIETRYLSFFLDEVYEYGNGNVALIRIFNAPLEAAAVQALYNGGNPFPAAIPEPATLSLWLAGLAALPALVRRRRLPTAAG
jgi:hypothetical protein